MSEEAAYGLLVLDKPAGVTSFDCVARVRRILGVKRVGHCGTLDPLAQGVLLMLIGGATRHQERFLNLEKEYWFQASFGQASETGDRQAKEIREVPFSGVTAERLRDVLACFVGEILQTPPRFSALKYKGRAYYRWARQGVEIPRVPRPVHVARFDLLRLQGPLWEARVVCSRGTYIRALVEDVGERLGTGAILERLVRERVGTYSRDRALSWDQLNRCAAKELKNFCDESIGTDPRHV